MQNSSIRIFQKGFNYSQDGPGNRLVYHLSGCNMRCPWCSNPEGLFPDGSTTVLTVDDIVKEAVSAKMIFIDGGGVTLTGGEVTCQKDSVLKLIKELRNNGIHTCIETNASLPCCEEIFDTVDYMIADFKSPSKEALKKITGADIDIIKSNLIHRAKTGKPLLVRIPLIRFFNSGKGNATAFGEFFQELKKYGNDTVFFEILTYHEFGKEKYAKLGMNYTVTDGYVSDDDINILLTEFKKRKINVINT